LGARYRSHALHLIDEERFAKYFDPGNGRPNKSVRLVVSVLLLKELKNLTDEEALEQLEWNSAWHYALDITPEEAHTCQKALHNFRKLLLDDDEGAGLFESTTARLVEAAGLRTGRQRLDSTHIVSNIKLLPYRFIPCLRLGVAFQHRAQGFPEIGRGTWPSS
jgi:hypothetical protein